MKKLFFFCSILALGATKPNGYYHQEYSYKSSSSSFKNNELQHKNEDQGFYSKDGDLEGRVKPKVNSESQHSEYRNPKLAGGYQAAGYSGASGANYLANSEGFTGGANALRSAGAVDGYASSDRVLDLSSVYNTRGYSSNQDYGSNQGYGTSQSNYGGLHSGGYTGGSSRYGYAQGGSGYGYVQHGSSHGTSGSYVNNANLNALMQRLQEDMSRQLDQAIYKQYQTSGYTTSVSNSQMNTDIRLLEEELKRNLTRQLQDSLRTQYGSNTYRVVEGGSSMVPNYSNQELAALTRRLEDDLISKLHQSVRTTYNRETSNTYTSSSNTYRPVVVYQQTTSRPYYDRPVITTPNVIRYTAVPSRQTIVSYPGNLVVETPRNIRYTPISNPDSLTQIASRTQTDINTYLDSALQNLYTTYLQTDRTSYYTVTDFDNEVNRIKDEIIRKLTYTLEDEIRKNYGQQILKNDYYYSISSNGDIGTQYNYNLKDYESLKKQVEENLLRKLNQTTNTYRNEYTQKQQSAYRESSNTYRVTNRPTYYTSGNQLYDYSDLQRQLSQQLQNALNQPKYSQSTSYSASRGYSPQTYQTSLDELTRELQRNLTEQLSSYRAQTSSSSSSSYGYMAGSSGGNADFESMKNQLQNQLMQQLRQGLQNQYQYSASASYSASSSSSANANYGVHQAYGSYPSMCSHGCSTRRKRDLSHYSYNTGKRHGIKSVRKFFTSQEGSNSETSFSSPRYLHYPQELSYPSHQLSGSYRRHFQSSHSRKHSSQTAESDPEIVEDLEITNHGTQNTETDQFEDLKQQLEQVPYKKTIKYIDQNELEQQQSQDTFSQPLQKIQDDLTQQLELGHRTTQQILANVGKLEDQNDLTQQLELPHHHSLLEPKAENQLLEDQNNMDGLDKFHQHNVEEQLSLSAQNIGQQLEDSSTIGHLHRPKHHDQELEGQLNLEQPSPRQQLENQNILGNLQRPNGRDQELEGQLTLSQQREDQNIIGYLHKPKHHDQELEGQLTLDQQTLGQQIEEQNLIGHLNKPKHVNQELEGQLTLDEQSLEHKLGDQNIIGHLYKPKHHDQELEGQLTLGQQIVGQLEEQNIIHHLHTPKHHNQQEQIRDNQNQQDLTQQLELEDIKKPGLVQVEQLEVQNSAGQFNKPNNNRNFQQKIDDQNEQDLTQQLELEDIPKLSQVPQLDYQNRVRQSNKRNYLDVQQQIGDDQNVQDITQQLELENTQKPELIQVQKLEISGSQKPKVSDQQIQESDELTQQLELSGAPKNKQPLRDYEQQQSNVDLNEQQDLSQLEFTYPRIPRPASYQQPKLESVQKPQQQIEDDDDLQQLELEDKPKNKIPKYSQETQQTEDDLTQQLEVSNYKYKKSKSDQQLQNQDDLDQKLELSKGQEQKSEDQEEREVNSQLVLQAVPNQTNQEVQGQVKDEPTQQLEDSNLVLTGTQSPNLNRVTLIPDQQLTINDQKLETTNIGNLRPAQREKQTVVDQKLEEPEQELELNSLSETNNKRNSISPQQTVNQVTEDNLNQQLELTDLQKPAGQEGQQLENDFSQIELTETTKPNPDLEELTPSRVSPESELSFSPDTSDSFQSSTVTEKTFKHTGHNVVTQVSQSRHYPKQVYGYGSIDQRPFTNGHSGHFDGAIYHTQSNMDSYENALRQQEALMDLLKKKVQEAHASNQDLYSHRTIKKTVFVNGKAVNTEESSQIIKPNGEIVQLQQPLLENSFSKNMYNTQLSGYIPSQHNVNTPSSYSGNTLRTYHVTGSPTEFSGNTQWFSNGKTFGQNPLSHFGTDLYGREFQGKAQTEISGKATRRIVQYINGKPISASEKVQIFKPNGEIIESHHDVPSGELNSFSNSFSNAEFGQNTYGLNVPQTYIGNHNSVSKHAFEKKYYINGKLVDFSSSSRNVGPNGQISEIQSGLPQTVELVDNFSPTPIEHSSVNFHTSGIKSTRHFEGRGY